MPALTPGTIEHFEQYARLLVLDNGKRWPIEDWQLEIVKDILAGVPEVWVIIPEANGKTTLMAGVALYHADYTRNPWVPIGAASRDQAEIMFGQASGFVERTPGLQRRFRVFEGYRKIKSLRNGGKGIKVYAAAVDTGDGPIPTLCLIDEPHRHKNLALYRTWKGKRKKRSASIVAISTAGVPGTDFERTRESIRNNATERLQVHECYTRYTGPQTVMHEWQVPKPEMARDIRLVKLANPLDKITEAELSEVLSSPTLDFNEDWLRLTCNIPARSSKSAVSDSDWDHAEVSAKIPAGKPIVLGADFAWVHDTTALVPLWMKSKEYRLFGPATILKPPRDGTMLDPQEVKDALVKINERNPIEYIVADKSKAEDTLMWAETELDISVVDRTQSNVPASDDYERFMEGLRGGKPGQNRKADEPRRDSWIKHTGDTGLREHVMNAIARKLPGDRYRFDRPAPSRAAVKQDERVIDALTAASMVHSVAVANLSESEVVPLVAVVTR